MNSQRWADGLSPEERLAKIRKPAPRSIDKRAEKRAKEREERRGV